MAIYSYAWTTDFTQPDPVANLAVEADTETVSLVVTWDASADDYHYEYLVEAQSDDGAWTEIGRTTDETLTYWLAPENLSVRIRVRDSNGTLVYSDPVEVVGLLPFDLWSLTETSGDLDFVQPMKWVLEDPTVDYPLDQTVIDPLSDGSGETSFPIVFTGQFQGERVSLNVLVPSDDRGLLETLRKAALRPAGTIALKSPDGDVFLVVPGAQRQTRATGIVTATISAIRVA